MVAKFAGRCLLALGLFLGWVQNARAAAPMQEYQADFSEKAEVSLLSSSIIYVPGTNNKNLQTAINEVSDGGIIEIANGTYTSPSGGFSILDMNKSFTVRAAPGATVILNGAGSTRVLQFRNSVENSAHIDFIGITFSNGFSSLDYIAAGVTLTKAKATFIDCAFFNNQKSMSPNRTVGDAVVVVNSTAFFYNATWQNNLSQDGGAAIGIRDSKVYIHNSRFINNQTTTTSTSEMPGGGAINVGNSTLNITNTRFEGNRSVGHGGAITAIGNVGTSGMELLITNSTFYNNQATRTISSPSPLEGGAIAVEDISIMRIFNSRFIRNSAKIGGALSIFRAKAEIYDSAFLGNQATDTIPTSGSGGAINFNYHDRSDYASLVIERTLFQGRYETVTTVAQFAGGLNVVGYDSAVRPDVTLRKVVFYDLDVTTPSSSTKGGTGGAMLVYGANLLIEDSFVFNCDAVGPKGGIGGGLAILTSSVATLTRTAFAYNTADTFGGALFVQGANISITDSQFVRNEISPGVAENEYASYGAAIFTTIDSSLNRPVTGSVHNSIFIGQIGMAIFDDDRSSGPINDVIYNTNSFYETSFGDRVYRDSLTPTQNPENLNTLIVTRSGGLPPTDKALLDNTRLTSAPTIAQILAMPASILPQSAAGDALPTTTTYVAYLWDGASADLNGTPLSTKTGIVSTTTAGQYTLSVGTHVVSAQITNGARPIFSTALSASPTTPVFSWNINQGNFLNAVMLHSLTITSASSGSVQLPGANALYIFYVVTREGGYWRTIDPSEKLTLPKTYIPFTLK
ncbi:MAG: hypothetical protein AB1894_16770 [Chloroflexota bacterium]